MLGAVRIGKERWSMLGRLLLAGSGAAAIWAFLVSHVIIQWVDGPEKRVTALLLGVILVGLVLVSAWRKRWSWRAAWLLVLTLFAIGELHRAWIRRAYHAEAEPIDPFEPVTTEDLKIRSFTVRLPALGAERVRVLHLTDLHVTDKVRPEYVERVRDAMRAVTPDLLVLTGDYLSRADRLPALARWLEGLPRAPYGAYAVLGNHDYWAGAPDAVRAALERAGVKVLSGACTTVGLRAGGALRVCGTEHPWGPDNPPPGSRTVPTLVLSHTPDNVYALAEQGVDAVFAGHTHAGQIRLPWLGAVVVPSNYGRRFDRGHFLVEKTHLFVSAGVGADSPPLRLWCPPKLVVVDLVGPGVTNSQP